MKAHGHVFKYGDNVDTDVIMRLQTRKDWLNTVWKILTRIL